MHLHDVLFFAIVLLVIFVARGALYSRVTRVGLFCLFALIVAAVLGLDFHEADGSLASLTTCVGAIVCASLTMIGVCAPVKFFVAFRVLGVVQFLRMVTGAVLTTDVPDRDDAWFATAALGLPSLWFAWKARAAPSRQTLHVVLDEANLPSFGQWQDFLRRSGYDLTIRSSTDLRAHKGNMPVIFHGAPTEFQFDVTGLAQFVALARMPDSLTKQLGVGRISANFSYRDEHDRPAALVACSNSDKAEREGLLFDAALEHWSDADDAIDTVQDIFRPNELHVLVQDDRVLRSDEWQSAINDSGLALAHWDAFDMQEFSGFLPLVVEGTPSGFAFAVSPSEFVAGGDLFPTDDVPAEIDDKTVSADFRFADGDQSLAARIAAATFAAADRRHRVQPANSTILERPGFTGDRQD